MMQEDCGLQEHWLRFRRRLFRGTIENSYIAYFNIQFFKITLYAKEELINLHRTIINTLCTSGKTEDF